MNFPPAPLSRSPGVSTFSFSVFPLILIGIVIELETILVVYTENISRLGETEVEATLLIKNPLLLLP